MLRFKLTPFIVLIVFLSFNLSIPAAAKPVKIRGSFVVPGAEIFPIMSVKTDILKNWGKSYVAEFQRFRGTSPMVLAFAAKELDVGLMAYSSFLIAIDKAKLDLKILAEDFKTGMGYFSNVWSVLEESPIKTVRDMRGKSIGTNAFGSAVDLHLRTMLKKNGLDPKKDVNIVEVGFPNQDTMLREKKIDVATMVQPFWAVAQTKGGVRAVFNGEDAMGLTQFVFMVGRQDFLKESGGAVKDFFEDFLIFWRWALDPANRGEMLKLTAKYTKIPEKVWAPWFLTSKDYYRDPMGEVDVAALQKNWNLLNSLGLIKHNRQASDYVDLSYIREAQRRLGLK